MKKIKTEYRGGGGRHQQKELERANHTKILKKFEKFDNKQKKELLS